MSDKLKNIFTHTDCISEEMLGKYASGTLSPAEKYRVEKHLADCEMCSDAVEGLAMIGDKNKISKITAELNRKIGERVTKKEVKVIFLQQYRSQLAIAASVVVLVGLVFFFRSNMSMKELDQESSDKIFAEKFEAPPADLATSAEEEKGTDAKEQIQQEYPVTAAAQEPVSKAMADEQNAKEGVKSGKDANSVQNLGWAANANVTKEDVPVQKAELETRAAEDDRSKNAEVTVKANLKTTTTTSDTKFRDEDALVSKKGLAENRNELEAFKEKDKKTEAKPQAVPANTSTSGGVVSGSYGYSSSPVVSDKSVLTPQEPLVFKQQNNKPAEEVAKAEEKKTEVSENARQVDVFALESAKKSAGKMRGKRKESIPEKSPGFYQTENTAASPATEAQTKVAQTETGAALDSVSQVTLTLTDAMGASGEATGLDAGMIKYDKQDYAGALGDFEATLKQNPSDEKALFYSAVSYMSLGQTEKAVTNLNKVLENKNGPYYDSAQWYLSLAYIKNNDTKNARRNLMELQNNSKSRYQKQADETLKQIQK